jgi:hypothetical protein
LQCCPFSSVKIGAGQQPAFRDSTKRCENGNGDQIDRFELFEVTFGGKMDSEFRWDEVRKQNIDGFRSAMNSTKLRTELFTEKFAEALEKRRDKLDERARRSTLLQGTVMAMLGIALIAENVPISILGMSTNNAANFREILILLLCSIPVYGLIASLEQSRISDALHIWCQKTANGQMDVLRVLKLRYGIGLDVRVPELTGRAFTKAQGIKFGLALSGFVVWFLITFMMVVGVEIATLISILRKPTISFGFSVGVAVYVLLANLTSFGVRSAMGLGGSARTPDSE